MMCDICGIEPALIHIEGVGNFCLDCHNERMAGMCGLDHDPFQYPRDIAVTDKDGEWHYFQLSHSVNTQISHVIQAIKVPAEYTKGTVRVSFGKNNNEVEAEAIGLAIVKILKK